MEMRNQANTSMMVEVKQPDGAWPRRIKQHISGPKVKRQMALSDLSNVTQAKSRANEVLYSTAL